MAQAASNYRNKPFVKATMGDLPSPNPKQPLRNPLYVSAEETPDIEPRILTYIQERPVYVTKGFNRRQRRRMRKGRNPWTGAKNE